MLAHAVTRAEPDPFQEGAAKDGAAKNGPPKNGPPREGAAKDGAAKDGLPSAAAPAGAPRSRDEFGDPESRRTLPPPGAISDHVAKMMAEAAMLDEATLSGLEHERGDRDTLEIFAPSSETLDALEALRAADSAKRKPLQIDPEEDSELRLVRSDRSPSLTDLSDLPAVFSLDTWSVDEPSLNDVDQEWASQDELELAPSLPQPPPAPPPAASPAPRPNKPVPSPILPPSAPAPRFTPRPRARVDASDPAFASPFPPINDPSISSPPVLSAPALSPPFASIDPHELAAELEQLSVPGAMSAPAVTRPMGAPIPGRAGAPEDRLAAIEARFAAGDYGRALVLAESALDLHPSDAAVTHYAESCRQMLYERYLERLGAADSVPRLLMQRGAITGLALDHRAGFLLSWVDGSSTIEELIDVSAMPKLEAVRILYELVQEGVIEMAAPR